MQEAPTTLPRCGRASATGPDSWVGSPAWIATTATWSTVSSFLTRVVPTVYVGFFFDWLNQGTVGYRPDQPFGQPRDLAEFDDVFEVVLTAFRGYVTEREHRERARRLTELNEPVIEGGVYFIIRSQDAEQGAGGFVPNDTSSDSFFPRSASALIPDLWVRLEYEPAFRQRIRLELEAAAVFGDIENALPALPDPDDPAAGRRDIQQFGLAFESDFRWDNLFTGLNAGFASGRTTRDGDGSPGWGVNDINTINGSGTNDRDITNFIFDRDYFIDMIMFREVIGAITNAIYFNPFIQYNFFTAQASAMGARLDAIYALAARPDSDTGRRAEYRVRAGHDALLSDRCLSCGSGLRGLLPRGGTRTGRRIEPGSRASPSSMASSPITNPMSTRVWPTRCRSE